MKGCGSPAYYMVKLINIYITQFDKYVFGYN